MKKAFGFGFAASALLGTLACSTTTPDPSTPGDAGVETTAPFDASPSPSANDASSDADVGPPPPPNVKRVFVTKKAWTGNLIGAVAGATDGLAAADALCSEAATKAKLDGQWKAYLSGRFANGQVVAAKTRLADAGPYYLVDRKTKVVDTLAKATSNAGTPSDVVLDHAIDMDENGDAHEGVDAWTGEDFAAYTVPLGCANASGLTWSVGTIAAQGVVGNMADTNSLWRKSGGALCSLESHLYCFEQ